MVRSCRWLTPTVEACTVFHQFDDNTDKRVGIGRLSIFRGDDLSRRQAVQHRLAQDENTAVFAQNNSPALSGI